MISKVQSYIGFCKKAGKLVTGVNSVAYLKKGVYLLIACHTATENTLKDIKKLSVKFNCQIVVSVTQKLEDVVGKENCKLVAVCEPNLAQAIIAASVGDFVIMEKE